MSNESLKGVGTKDMLAGIIHLHPDVRTVHDEKNGYYLTWTNPVEEKKGLLAKLWPTHNAPHRLLLDDIGRRTIELIDGKHTVKNIAVTLELEFKLEDEAASQAALIAFLTQLMQRNIITVGKK